MPQDKSTYSLGHSKAKRKKHHLKDPAKGTDENVNAQDDNVQPDAAHADDNKVAEAESELQKQPLETAEDKSNYTGAQSKSKRKKQRLKHLVKALQLSPQPDDAKPAGDETEPPKPVDAKLAEAEQELPKEAAADGAQAEPTTANAAEAKPADGGGQLPKGPALASDNESHHGSPILASRMTVLDTDKKTMMDAYFNPGTATFRTFEASWVTNREARRPTSALFMTGVVGSTLILLVLVIILVIRYQQPLVCGSVICDYYSNLLSESLDPSVDPCTDFHQFVCSGWEASNNKPLVVDVYKRFISKVSLHAWKMAIPSTGQSASQKGAMFYKSCYGVYGSKEDHLEAIKSSLLSAHVHWPEVNSNASLLRVLFSMTAEWNWASPIHFLLYRAGKLEVKPTGFYTATLEKRQAMLRNPEQGSYFADYYQKLVQAFSRPDVEPLPYANLSALEDQVMSTLLVPLRLAKWRSMTNASLDDLMILAKGAFPRNLWEEELPTLCNKTGECGNVEFTIWNVDFISAFFSLVHSEGEQRMVYYVGWCVVQAVSRLANDDLLRYSYRSDQEAENGHAAFCSGLAHHYMGLAFYAEFINREIAPSAIKGAMTMIRNIRDVFQARIKDPKMRALLVDVPSLAADSDTSDALQLLKEAKKEALEETYKHFPDMTNYAMENAARATAAARQTEADTRIRGYLGGAFPRVFYLKAGGFELLPIAFEWPLYNDQAPLGANYGALGSYIATAFVQLVFQALINADTDALMEFENKSSCFHESLEAGGNETLLKGTNLDLVQRAVAVRLLYSAYWPLDLRSVKMRLRGHPLITEKQLLFIFWCIFQCGKPNARDQCNVPLKAFRIFGVNFGCHRGSHMYTGRECPVLT